MKAKLFIWIAILILLSSFVSANENDFSAYWNLDSDTNPEPDYNNVFNLTPAGSTYFTPAKRGGGYSFDG